MNTIVLAVLFYTVIFTVSFLHEWIAATNNRLGANVA